MSTLNGSKTPKPFPTYGPWMDATAAAATGASRVYGVHNHIAFFPRAVRRIGIPHFN